jgi:hypothetical protein
MSEAPPQVLDVRTYLTPGWLVVRTSDLNLRRVIRGTGKLRSEKLVDPREHFMFIPALVRIRLGSMACDIGQQ